MQKNKLENIMKIFMKFGLLVALCVTFVACESDSGSNANEHPIESSSSVENILSSSLIQESSSSIFIEYGELLDNRDNQTYKTVTIGDQTWMAENLNYAYNEPTAELDSSSFCYNNESDSCDKYGRLYLWSAAMDSATVFSDDGMGCGSYANCNVSEPVRGVCPNGWHLPSEDEWKTLFAVIGGLDFAGRMLKSTSGWNNDGNGEDSYGFSVLPAGSLSLNPDNHYGRFCCVGEYAYFWSSTEEPGFLCAFSWVFSGERVSAWEGNGYEYDPVSVRCVRDSVD